MERTVSTKRTVLRKENRFANFRYGFICGLLFVFVSLLLATNVNAQAVGRPMVPITNQDGQVVFLIDFWGVDDGDWMAGSKSDRNFTQQERNAIAEAAQYWVNIIKPSGSMPIDPETGQPQPVVIRIGNDNDIGHNAFARPNGMIASDTASGADKWNTVTKPQALIADGFYNDELSSPYTVDENGNYYGTGDNPHATIGIGTGWSTANEALDVSGRVAQDLSPVLIHEIGHALGITNDYTVVIDPETGLTEYAFSNPLTRWASRLRDANGKIAQPGLIIQHPDELANPDNYFDVGSTHGLHEEDEVIPSPTFVGKNVLELWYGKPLEQMTAEERNRGIPIEKLMGFPYAAPGEWDWDNGMSHINVTNGLMSHQGYRNYGGFIEIELAAMQDIGYTIERRDFFGKSYYQDGDGHFDETTGKWNYGTQIRNTNGFSKWDYGSGTYAGTPNLNSFAIGTHLFANNLNVLQAGDILADGAGSAGVRIDGQNNQVTIENNTKIITNGVNGTGVLAAYGSNHNIIHQGYIEASNYGGKGISINFGLPFTGDVRGSYYVPLGPVYDEDTGIASPDGVPYVFTELDGPLVNNLDITGTVIGDKVHSSATYRQIADTLPDTYWYRRDENGNDTKQFNLGAAIYIDQTAHLANLNIMNGAVIDGDIISFWTGTDGYPNYINQGGQWTGPNGFQHKAAADADEVNQYSGNTLGNILNDNAFNDAAYRISDKQTNLTFGLKAAADGSSTDAVDPNFHIVYKGNINYFRYELFPDLVTEYNPETGNYTPWAIWDDDADIYQTGIGVEDTFWRFLTWDDGFFFTDNRFFTFERDMANRKVYAGVSTPGLVDLRFAAGTTELVGSKVYVRNATIDYGATLILTPDPTRKYTVADPQTDGYGQQHNGEPEIHVATSWDDSVYDAIWSQKSAINVPQEVTDEAELARQKALRYMTNDGHISGNGNFYVGGITHTSVTGMDYQDNELLSQEYQRTPTNYIGTFINNGVISPGANNGNDVGTISIFGDLRLNNTGTYEVTLSRLLRTSRDGSPVDEDGNYILANGDVVDAAGNIVYDEVYDEITHQFQQTRRKRDPVFVESNDKLTVSGETRVSGMLKVSVAPGSVFDTSRSKYTIIESGVFTPGSNFDKIISDAAFLSFLPELEFVQQRSNGVLSVLAQLTVIRDMEYFARFASGKTHNQVAVGNALDSSLNYDSYLGFTLGHQGNSNADMLNLYDQLGAAIRANSIMMNLWNPAEMVFNHIGYGNGQMQTGGRGGINWRRIQERRARMLGQSAVPNRTGSMWGNYFHTSFNAAADGNSPDYNFDRNGFVVGAEMNITPYSALGFNIAYSGNSLHQGTDKAEGDDYQFGLYLVAAPFDEFEIKSYLGMGIQEYDMDRRIQSANFVGNWYNGATWDTFNGINEHYNSKASGNTFNYSLELARPVMLHPAFILRPTLGLDVQYISQGHFKDGEDRNGTNFYRLNYNGTNLDRTLLRAGFSSEMSGYRGGLRARTFYVSNVGGDLYPVSKSSFIAGSDPFTVYGTKLGKNYLNLGISGNLYLDGAKTSSFFFDYDADIYNTHRKIYNHSFNIGFVQNF